MLVTQNHETDPANQPLSGLSTGAAIITRVRRSRIKHGQGLRPTHHLEASQTRAISRLRGASGGFTG